MKVKIKVKMKVESPLPEEQFFGQRSLFGRGCTSHSMSVCSGRSRRRIRYQTKQDTPACQSTRCSLHLQAQSYQNPGCCGQSRAAQPACRAAGQQQLHCSQQDGEQPPGDGEAVFEMCVWSSLNKWNLFYRKNKATIISLNRMILSKAAERKTSQSFKSLIKM